MEKNESSSSARRSAGVFGVAFDVAQELGGGELAVDHVAFQLGHVDAVGREAAQRLVQRGGDVADAEDEGGHQVRRGRVDLGRLRRHDVEAGGVVGGVFDVARRISSP